MTLKKWYVLNGLVKAVAILIFLMQKYHDVYVEDKTKYAEEYSRVYGRTLRKKAPKS